MNLNLNWLKQWNKVVLSDHCDNEYKEVQIEINKFNLLILLTRKRVQYKEITKYKARLVMEGSRAKVGEDVFDV